MAMGRASFWLAFSFASWLPTSTAIPFPIASPPRRIYLDIAAMRKSRINVKWLMHLRWSALSLIFLLAAALPHRLFTTQWQPLEQSIMKHT
jgi:hypothetical protein